MPFEFNSNQNKVSDILLSESILNKEKTVIQSNYYQPNFILVNQSNKNSILLFGDILPIYRSYQELTNIVVASWEGLNSLILLSQTFATCLLSLINNVLHNTVYQGYLFFVSSYEQILLLPNRYNSTKKQVVNLLEVFNSAQTRELWWLELKLDLKNIIRSVEKALGMFFQVTQKFYLALLVFFSLAVLNLVSFSSVNIESKSFLSKFIDNYTLESYSNAGNIYADASVDKNNLASFAPSELDPQFETILSYETKENDNVESLSQIFGISKETIILNNNLKSEDVKPGEKIYAPFTDGYIVSLDKDTSVDDLSKISKVESSTIINQNKDLFDIKSKSFKKDSLVLVPTTEVKVVFDNFKAEQDRLSSIAQAQEQAKNRTQRLSRAAIPVSLNPEVKEIDSSKAKSFGFTSPVSYSYISRCFSAGHRGCDLVASEGTTLRATQDGVISRVMNFDVVGYGIGIIVDHGNGLSTLNAHLSKVDVKAGDVVKKGQKIGETGCTGRCYGAHLHFEVRVNGKQVDPKPYLP